VTPNDPLSRILDAAAAPPAPAGAVAMTTRELIGAEIEKVPEDRLDELYDVVRSFTAPTASSAGATMWVMGQYM